MMFWSCLIICGSNYIQCFHFDLLDMELVLWKATQRRPKRTAPLFFVSLLPLYKHTVQPWRC